MQVTFDDGAVETFDTRLHIKDAGLRGPGATVPVRYDPADRKKIAVDEQQLRDQRETSKRQREEALATVADTPLPTGGPTAQLDALHDQLKALDARGSELRRAAAPREQVGAWVAEREAVDARYRALRQQHPEWSPS